MRIDLFCSLSFNTLATSYALSMLAWHQWSQSLLDPSLCFLDILTKMEPRQLLLCLLTELRDGVERFPT